MVANIYFDFNLDSPKFYKFMHERKWIKLGRIKNSDIIGFEDFIFNNKYFFIIECVSERGEGFRIQNHVRIFLKV
jgi:hypothetical protein